MFPGKAYESLNLLPGDEFTTTIGSSPKTVVEPPSDAHPDAADDYIFFKTETGIIVYSFSYLYLKEELFAVKRSGRGKQTTQEEDLSTVCPKCGSAGEWVNFALKCTNHTCWNVW